MISYAGVPLHPPSDALRDVLAEWWDQHGVEEFDHPGYHVKGLDHLPVPYPPKRTPPRIGVLSWPVGAVRWATFHCYVTRETLDAILRAVRSRTYGVTATDSYFLNPHNLSIADGRGGKVEPLMWMLPPRPVLATGGGELYLITLVCERYFYWRKPHAGLYQSGLAWAGLFTAYHPAVYSTLTAGNISTVPSAYLTPSGRWFAPDIQPQVAVFEAACRSVGMRYVLPPAGTPGVPAVPAVRNYDAANAASAALWETHKGEVLVGGRLAEAECATGAAFAADVLPADYSPTAGVAYTDALRVVRVKPLSTAPSGTDQVLDLPAYKDAVLFPLNASLRVDAPRTASAGQLDALAYQAALDYYQWHLSRVDCTFRGIVPWGPTGLEDRVEWEHTPERVVTRVRRTKFADAALYGAYRSGVESAAPVAAVSISLTADATWTASANPDHHITIPSGGWWLVATRVRAEAVVNAAVGTIKARLYDQTTGAALAGTEATVLVTPGTAGTFLATAAIVTRVYVGGPTEIRVQGQRSAGPVYTLASCGGGAGNADFFAYRV